MKSAPFEYARPTTLTEALDLLDRHGEDCKPLAGGQSLVPLLAMRLARPSLLVDLDRVPELRGFSAERVGAMATNAQLERRAGDLPPVIAAALPHIGHFQIRNRGTVGGSLAHLDPAGEWPALALLLEAELTVESWGPMTTALGADELLLSVSWPRWPAGARWAFAEVARRPGDFALAGAACTVIAGRTRAVVFAVGPLPQLAGDGDFEVTGDLHASAAYRREVGKRLLDRVMTQVAM
ncbi:MAG: xanthine dehydrogenase family protein subunit M [Chloroflexi bacterium]|nr:MAG: xanthine dehydrogenase family protein subunit M [Chloroflexota bacterium]